MDRGRDKLEREIGNEGNNLCAMFTERVEKVCDFLYAAGDHLDVLAVCPILLYLFLHAFLGPAHDCCASNTDVGRLTVRPKTTNAKNRCKARRTTGRRDASYSPSARIITGESCVSPNPCYRARRKISETRAEQQSGRE